MADKFTLTEQFGGYRHKGDVTKIDPVHLVDGSQNCLILDDGKVEIRKGYTLVGAAASGSDPIISSYDWRNSSGDTYPLRVFGTTLQFLYSSTLYDLFTITDGAQLNFTTWWSQTDLVDYLLFVQGDPDISMWTGATAVYSSATSNTLTKTGSATWAETRWLSTGTRGGRILDSSGTWNEFTYTGGESTTTLTGVSIDITSLTLDADALIVQSVRTTSNTPGANFNNNFISTQNNQVYISDDEKSISFVSDDSDYTSFVTSRTGTTRVPGAPELLTFDGPTVGYVPTKRDMYVAAGDFWYRTRFTLSQDNSKEFLDIDVVDTGDGQGALSQDLMVPYLGTVLYVSREPALRFIVTDELGNLGVEGTIPLSDKIKNLFDSYDFTNAHMRMHRNVLHIAVPSESRVLMYDFSRKEWQPPQVLPARRLSIFDGAIHAHSNTIDETYKLFDGRNDNGQPIDCIMRFGYNSNGRRDSLKRFDEYFTEGMVSSNATPTLLIRFELNGGNGTAEFEIDGSDTTILFDASATAGFGQEPLGHDPLGTTSEEESDSKKFRQINNINNNSYYEYQTEYQIEGDDVVFEILSHGPNRKISETNSNTIKKNT